MIRSIVDLSTRFRVLVLAIAAALVVIGVVLLPTAAVDAVPEFSPPYVEVQTEALGLSAEEVEQLITVPLEADLLNGVAWLDSIESQSVQSLSSILLTFEPGTDPVRARQMVAERLTQAHALPNVSKPPAMLQPLSSANRLMMVGLSSDELSLMEMSVLARWNIRPRLMGVPGVANVAVWGQRERQLQVLVDPERLNQADVALDEVVETAGNALWWSPLTFLEASTPGTGGFIDTPNQRLGVQHIFPIDTADDLARVTLDAPEGADGTAVRLGDIADVVEDHQPLIGDAMVDGSPALILVVEKFPEANTLAVTEAVDDALEAMAPGLTGVEIDSTVFRPATFIESAIDNLTIAALIGMLLLAVVVTGLLMSWRAALVSLVVIPVSLIMAGLVLHLAGATINGMVVAGFVAAAAIIVDDAIIGTTAILRRHRDATALGTERPWRTVLIEAVVGMRVPVVYATIVIALAALPLFFIGGVTGAFVPATLFAYFAALVVSSIVAMTVAPALSYLLMRRTSVDEDESPVVARAQAAYGRMLNRLQRHTRSAFVVTGAVALGVVALFAVSMAPRVSGAGLPAFQERDILVRWNGAPGTSHTEMNRIVGKATSELRELPGVRSVGAQVGRAITSDQVVSINSGEIWLSMEPDADYDATLASVESVVDGYPGLERDVTTYPAERIERILGGRPDDVVVRVFGQDLAAMREKAAEVRDLMADVAGVSAAEVEPQIDEAAIQIEVDLEAAGAHNLKPGDVRRAAATMLSGIEVGSLFEDQKVFEVVVWGTPESRESVTGISELLIETPQDELVALGDVADVRIAPAPTVIRRDAVQRAIDVTATVSGRDVGAVLSDVETALATVEFPLESHAEVLGATAEREALRTALIAVGVSVLIGIFLVLQAAFGSWRLAFGIFAVLPAAVVGGVLAAIFLDEPGSIGSVIGLLAILGLAARNGVLLVDRARHLELLDPASTPAEHASRAARDRLWPTLTTALATAALMLPLAFLGPRAGLEVVHPMALVILGGLVSSTLINLFVVPTLFMRSGTSPAPEAVPISIEQAREPHVIGAG